MIIDLGRKIFVIHPDKRFSKQLHVPEGTLIDLYRRHKKLEYTIGDLKEFFYIRTHIEVDRKNLWTWLQSIEIYNRAQMARKVGAKYVTPEFFGNNTQTILRIFQKAAPPDVTPEDEESINDVYRRIEEQNISPLTVNEIIKGVEENVH